MKTINKAMKAAERDEEAEWTIEARVLSRQIFISRRDGQVSRLLIITLVDQEGAMIEVKSWSEQKAYTVYRKFKENSCLQISGSGPFRVPNRKYSMAKSEVYYRWFLDSIDDFKHKGYIYALSNIHKFHLSRSKPATVAGLFIEYCKGPVRKTASGFLVAQGFYVKLLDDQGHLFQALVWSNVNLEKNKFPLNYCDQDSIVLFVFAREQEEKYRGRTPNIYTLTTTYPPVVNAACLNPDTKLALLNRRRTREHERHIPYVLDQGDD